MTAVMVATCWCCMYRHTPLATRFLMPLWLIFALWHHDGWAWGTRQQVCVCVCVCVCVLQFYCTACTATTLPSQVRMQSEGKLAAGVAKKYPSAFAAYGIIARCAGL